VIEQVAVDGAEVPITKTPIEDATPSTVSAGGDGTTPPVEGDTDTGSSTGHPADTGTPDDTGTLCSDTCMYAGDGECDDGGPGALWAECALGSDCSDCGVREAGGSVDTDSGDTGQDTAVACSGSGAAGSYPDGSDDFNGLQVSYAINGVCLDEGTDSDGFTITRSFPVWGINGSSVTVSGSVAANDAVCNSDYGSFWFQTDVSLTVGGVSDTFSSPEPCTQSTTERYEVAQPAYTFDLSVPVSGYGDSVSFSISQTYVNPRFGDRGVVVSGNTSY